MNEPQKAAPEIKESNYSHKLNIERNMSHSCTVQRTLLFFHRLSVCVCAGATVSTGEHVFVFVSTLLFCQLVHSNYTVYYLVSPASKVIWKLALKQQLIQNSEEKNQKRRYFEIAMLEFGPNQNCAFGKKKAYRKI